MKLIILFVNLISNLLPLEGGMVYWPVNHCYDRCMNLNDGCNNCVCDGLGHPIDCSQNSCPLLFNSFAE